MSEEVWNLYFVRVAIQSKLLQEGEAKGQEAGSLAPCPIVLPSYPNKKSLLVVRPILRIESTSIWNPIAGIRRRSMIIGKNDSNIEQHNSKNKSYQN
jgi:hypothetical protein